MGLFNTNWRTQITNILPPLMRSGTMKDFISALVHPLQTDINDNVQFDADTRVKARINGQIMVLRGGLNYLFNITIAPFILVQTVPIDFRLYSYLETEGSAPFYSYLESESNPPAYSYLESETLLGANFIVKIPAGIYTTTVNQQVIAYTTTFKLSGKTFITQTY